MSSSVSDTEYPPSSCFKSSSENNPSLIYIFKPINIFILFTYIQTFNYFMNLCFWNQILSWLWIYFSCWPPYSKYIVFLIRKYLTLLSFLSEFLILSIVISWRLILVELLIFWIKVINKIWSFIAAIVFFFFK